MMKAKNEAKAVQKPDYGIYRKLLIALTAVLVGRLAQLESFGVPYLAPFAPGQGKDGYGVLRWPTHRVKFREAILHTRNRRRQG